MGIETAAIGLAGLGSLWNAYEGNKAAKRQRRRGTAIDNLILPGIERGPSYVEQEILNRRQMGPYWDSGIDLPSYLRDYNIATDSIIQSMRRGPNTDFLGENLRELTATGDPYDMTDILTTLRPLRQRDLDLSVADLQAAAPGLGARFGSALRQSEVDLRRQSAEDFAAQDAQLLYGAHESAADRRLRGASGLMDLERLELDRGTSMAEALFRGSQGMFEGARIGLARQAQEDQLLQLLLGAQDARLGRNLQGIGIMAGIPVASGPGYGGSIGDIGQLLLISQLLGGQRDELV